MGRKINHGVIVDHLVNLLEDNEQQEVKISNTTRSLKIIDTLVSILGPLITTTDGDRIIIKRPKKRERVDLPAWEVQKYCNERGIVIYPRQVTFGKNELIVERQGLMEAQPGIYDVKPKPGDEKWWEIVSILYEHEFLNLKSIENE